MVVVMIAVLSIPLRVGATLGLSAAETTGWLLAVYGVSGVLSLVLTFRYRQPLLLTGNIFVLIFIASLGNELSWSELVGASMVAGALVLLLGPLGLTHRLAIWIPAPIIFGLLAGAVLPFFVDLFSALGNETAIVGGALLAYLVGRRVLQSPQIAIMPALVAGLAVAAITGELGSIPTTVALPAPVLTGPVFSLRAILTATPVIVVLITLQADIPSIVFLRSQGYDPPERTVALLSGAGTLFGSLLGPMGVSLSLPATALCAGPDAGELEIRHWSVYMVSGAALLIALFAGFATELAAIVPEALLAAGVGLAIIGVLSGALQQVAGGPLLLGPMFAFATALSNISLLGLGPFFWALIFGLVASLLLERDAWKALHANATA
jgi:benzoate membrane transport protein